MPETRSRAPLVWIDCEVRRRKKYTLVTTAEQIQMTGLDPHTDTIMSLACYITDSDLNLLEPEGFQATIHHTEEELSKMGEWCVEHHGASALTAACLSSNMTALQAAQDLLAYIQRLIPERRKALLAGNSVHADKAFLLQEPYKPVIEYLHYRILDVSSLKEAARRWASEHVLAETPGKEGRHEAKADVLESIEEARFYRKAFFLS